MLICPCPCPVAAGATTVVLLLGDEIAEVEEPAVPMAAAFSEEVPEAEPCGASLAVSTIKADRSALGPVCVFLTLNIVRMKIFQVRQRNGYRYK